MKMTKEKEKKKKNKKTKKQRNKSDRFCVKGVIAASFWCPSIAQTGRHLQAVLW
jgi:hypothetical protein